MKPLKQSPLKVKKSLTATKSLKSSRSLSASTGKGSKQKKPSVSKLKKKADALYSLYVRLRDSSPDGLCECITCFEKKPIKSMQAGHFMSRRFNSTRYEEENCNAQCYRCNVAFNGEQYKYGLNVDLKYGTGTAKKLMKMSAVPHQFTTEELQQIIDDAKTAIAFYEKE